MKIQPLRIAFIHDNVGVPDGVKTVYSNDMGGFLKLLHPYGIPVRFHLIGDTRKIEKQAFSSFDPRLITITGVDDLATKNTEINNYQVTSRAEQCARALLEAVKADDIIIYENPLIGYWPVALEAFPILAHAIQIAYPAKDFICRVHDLAEDRPDTVMPYLNNRYADAPDRLRQLLYPSGIILATMNRLIIEQMREKNPDVNINFLPNGVKSAENVAESDRAAVLNMLDLGFLSKEQETKVITYPVRSLPRKRIEESILVVEIMNQIFKKQGPFQLALPPTGSPVAESYSDRVAQFLKEINSKHVKYLFKEITGERLLDGTGQMVFPSIYDLIYASAAVITTAKFEGFGYAFIEPFMIGEGRPIFGRELEITRTEFISKGIDYGGYLYKELLVNGTDFAQIDSLDEKFKIIIQILNTERLAAKFVDDNREFFEHLAGFFADQHAYIKNNQEIIGREFSPQVIAKRILTHFAVNNTFENILGRFGKEEENED